MGILFFSAVACKREEIDEKAADVVPAISMEARLSSQFSHVEWMADPQATLYAQLSALPSQSTKEVDFPHPQGSEPFRLSLRRNDVAPDGLTGTLCAGKTLSETADLGIRTFDGTVQGGGTATVTVSPEFLSASLEVGSETWVIESSRLHGDNAMGKAIAYREQDMQPMPEMKQTIVPSAPAGGKRVGEMDEPVPTASNCWQIEVMAHGDFAFLQRLGWNQNAALFLMVNAVNNSSTRFTPINIHLTIPTGSLIQNTQADNLSSNIITILDQLKFFDNILFANRRRDLTIMYTGLNLRYGNDTSPVQNSFGQTLCVDPGSAYAVAESFNGWYNTRIQTHPIASVLGATPELNCSGSLMYLYHNHPCAGEQLSNYSRNQINTHIWFNHGCIYMAPGC